MSADRKIAVITGATKGIGLSLCVRLIKEGYFVYGVSLSESGYNEVKSQLDESAFKWLACDISNESEVKQVLDSIPEQSIHLLVNNAGYIDTGFKIEDIPAEEFHKVFEVNVYGTFYTIQALMSRMNKENGVILNVSSNAGKRGVPKIAGYSASKFAVVGLSQSIAKENLDNGLSVYTLCPGGTNTQMRERIFRDAVKQQSPDTVADIAWQMINEELDIETGDDVVVSKGEVIINKMPKV